tara:strand:- start:3993 stop:4388 length:396 start_codon:yes stop_codon:yes gene_type:complete
MRLTAAEYRALVGKAGRSRKSKFRRSPAIERTVDGIVFASKAEVRRYGYLRELQRIGEIESLTQGREYQLVIRNIKVGVYTPDFEYVTASGDLVIEEVKSGTSGKETDYRLRKRIFEACTGLVLTEVQVNG